MNTSNKSSTDAEKFRRTLEPAQALKGARMSRLKITFQGIEPSPALDARVRIWLDRLEAVHDRISRCEVVIDSPHRHHRNGRDFDVHVTLALPHGHVVASSADHDPYIAVRDAFRAARRQLTA